MRVLTQVEADKLLQPLGLKIGDWNRLNELGPDESLYRGHHSSRNSRELYVLAGYLLKWLAPRGWVLLQVDNSTWPSEDERLVFETLVFNTEQRWQIDKQRSFLFGDAGEEGSDIERTRLVLLIYFALMFQWHVYLTCENAKPAQHLGLQDGVAYLIGDTKLMDAADAILRQYAEDPERLSESRP